MDPKTKTRHVVQRYSYKMCACLFDALKAEPNFFESEDNYQLELEEASKQRCPVMAWKPSSIEGKHWVPALMNTMRGFYLDIVTHRNFFEKDGLDADEGILHLVIKECFKRSGYDKSEEYRRICEEQPNTHYQPWNFWLWRSLSLQDKNKAESGLTFRYFCGWLISLLSRTVKWLIHDMGLVTKTEVHVVALTAEAIFLEKLAEKGRQGSLKDAVLGELPSNFLGLEEVERTSRKRRVDFQDVYEDMEEEFVPTNENPVSESKPQYLKRVMDSSSMSLTKKSSLAAKIKKEFKSDLDKEVERLEKLDKMMTEIQYIFDKESEKFRRAKLHRDGMDKLLKSIGNLGVPKPPAEHILHLKNTLDEYLLTHHGSRTAGSIPVVKKRRFPDVRDMCAHATSVDAIRWL